MFHTVLLILKTLIIISCVEVTYSWTSQCSPCKCYQQSGPKQQKITDCSNSVTNFLHTKIPQLQQETETVFLVGQHLDIIPEEAFFKGLKNNLKFVDLKNCKVRIINSNAFKNLAELSGLDLSHNLITELNENIFNLNKKLRILILQNNFLNVLPEKILYNLPQLKYLDISKNNLHYLHPKIFQNNLNLERIILQHNYLTQFDQSLIANLQKINVLYLDNNPWKCDCQTRDLQKLLINRKIDFVYNNIYPLCIKPDIYKNKKWLEVKQQQLCSVPTTEKINLFEGEDFEFICGVVGNVELKWFLNGVLLNLKDNKKYETYKNGNNYVLKVNNIENRDKGNYKCWNNNIKDSNIQFEEIILDVHSGTKPSINSPEYTKKIIQKGTINYKLECPVSGLPKPEVIWLFNNEIISSFNDCGRQISIADNNLIFNKVESSCFGNYTCRAKNPKGISEIKFDLSPLPDKPEIKINNIDKDDIIEGATIQLNCFVTEEILLEVNWLRNGENIFSSNKYNIEIKPVGNGRYNYILEIKNISDGEAGNYKCRANSVESPEFTVNVKPAIEPSIDDFANDNEIILEYGGNKDIPCNVNGIKNPDIKWILPSCNKNSYTEYNILYLQNVVCPGIYKCVVNTPQGKLEKEFKLTLVKPKIIEVKIETNNTDKNIYENDNIILSCLIENAIDSTPFWVFVDDGKPIENDIYHELNKIHLGKNRFFYNLKLKSVSRFTSGEYRCSVGVEAEYINVNVLISNPPKIEEISNATTYVESGTKDFKLQCKISGAHASAVWISTNNLCPFEQTFDNIYKIATLIIKEVTKSCTAKYKCVTNSKLGTDEKTVDLNVVTLEPPEPKIESNSINKEILENDEIVLHCLIKGAVVSKPQWIFNGNYNPNKYKIVSEPISETSYWYNLIIKDLKPEDTGNYKCVIGNHEKNIYLNITPTSKPKIEYISNNQTIEEGRKNVMLACKITGKSKSNWIKTKENNNCLYEITRDENNNHEWLYLTFSEITPSCSGSYLCIASNSKGETKSNVNIFVISTNEPPLIQINSLGTNNNVIESEDVILKCFIKTHLYKPEWLYNGRIINENNKYKLVINPHNSTSYWYNLIISNVSPEQQGIYKCRVNNFENEIKIIVQESKQPVIEYISNTNIVEVGKKDFILSCKVNGVPKPNVYWYHNEIKIDKTYINNNCKYNINSEIVDNTVWLYLNIKNVESSCAGHYKCTAENIKGGEQSEFKLSVVKPQPPEIIQPKHVFENENITLKCLIKNSVDSKPYWMYNNNKIYRNNKYKIVMLPINETNYWYNLDIINVSSYDAGNYKCKINDLESIIPLDIKLSIKPYFEIISPTILQEDEKNSLNLPCQAKGTPTPEIVWLFENTPIINTNTFKNCLYEVKTNNLTNTVVLIIKNATTNCSGKYTCIAKNIKGNIHRETKVKINTLLPPTIQVVPTSNQEISENGQVTLKCLVPHRKYTAEWYKKDELIYMEPNSRYEIMIEPVTQSTAYWYNLVISDLSLGDAGKYKCKINNLESNLNLDVKPSKKPFIEYISPKNTIITEGTKNFKLACKISGIPIPQVEWILDDNSAIPNNCNYFITSEVTNNTKWIYLNLPEVTNSCRGKYKCIATNSAGRDIQEIILSVTSAQIPEITLTSTSQDGVVREHDNITIKCLSTGNINAKINWFHNNNLIDIKNNRYEVKRLKVNELTAWYILTIKNVNFNDIGDYSCKTNNIQQSYNLEIDQMLEPNIEYFTKSKYIVDENKNTILPCKVTNVGNNKIEWTFNNVSVFQSNCANNIEIKYEKYKHFEWYNLTIINIKPECSGKYNCIIKNFNKNNNNDIDLTVLPTTQPEIEITNNSDDENILENDSILLKCFIINSNTDAKWFFGEQEIFEDEKHKFTKLIINETSYWFNLEILKISVQQSGNYKCKTDKSETTKSVVVNFGFKPIIEQISNKDLIIEEGVQEIKLFCKAKASPLPTIQWIHEFKSTISPGECKFKSIYEQNSNTQWNYLKITNIKPSCSGKIQCKAQNTKGITSEYINLTVIPIQKPKITINSTSPDKIIREGDDVILNCLATGKNNIPAKWFFIAKYGDNKNNNFRFLNYEINPLTYQYDLIIKNISKERAGRYYCKRNSAENFIDIDVQNGISPTIDQFPNSQNIVSYFGATGPTLYCKGFGRPNPDIIWLFNNKIIDTITKNQCKMQFTVNNNWNNLTIINPNSCSGNYTCLVKNFKGKIEKNISFKVIPLQKPEIKINNNNSNEIIAENDEVLLKCLIKGDIMMQILWLHNGKIIKIDENHKITKEKLDDVSFWYILYIKNISLLDKGNYQCKTPVSHTDINLNIKQSKKPVVNIKGPNKIFIKENAKELTLECAADGVPIPSMSWIFNNKPIENISQCSNGCQYNLRKINSQWLYLTIKNISELCTGRYYCFAENSIAKVNQYVDVVVVPENHPLVNIQEPVNTVLNTDVTVTCEIKSVDQPSISWKCSDKSVESDKSKYSVRYTKTDDLYYYYLTINNFQQSDSADCSCIARIDNQENTKTISLKPKEYSKAQFVNSVNLWDNFQYINGDLIFTTKVKGFPMPTLKWTYDDADNIITSNLKYLSKTSYIKDDTYWFNQTIKNFNIDEDSGTYTFIVKNYLGEDDKQYFIDTEQQSKSTRGKIEILIDYNKNVKIPEAT